MSLATITVVEKKYPSGKKWVERIYEDYINEYDFKEVWYYENGNRMWFKEFKDGELNGEVKEYDSNGKLMATEYFTNGESDGYQEKWRWIWDFEKLLSRCKNLYQSFFQKNSK